MIDPKEIVELRQAVFGRRKGRGLLDAVERLGWRKDRAAPCCGAWWLIRKQVEALVAFSGPDRVAVLHHWRGR